MAKFSFNGVDSLEASFEQLSQLSDEEKLSILLPSGQLLLERQKEKLRKLFKRRTGDLEDSLTLSTKKGEESPIVTIYPTGKHRNSFTGKRIKKGRSSGKYSGTNVEVAYILNYGSPRIPATHWLENANEEAEADVIASQQEAFNELLEKKGL